MLKKIFSKENIKKHNINLEEAYISCPKEKHSTHKGYFIVDAKSEDDIRNFFEPIEVEVKEVVPFNVENI